MKNEYSEALAKTSPATFNAANRLAEQLGTKVEIRKMEDWENGKISDGVVTLNSRLLQSQSVEEAFLGVLAHESYHRMMEVAPNEALALRDYVAKLYTAEGNLDETISRYIAGYKGKTKLTEEGALEEITADFIKKNIKDTKLFAEAMKVEDNRSWGRKLIDSFKELIARIKRTVTGKEARDAASVAATGQKLSAVEEAVKLWEKGLQAATKAVKTDKATNNGRSISPGRARAEKAKNNTAQGGGKMSLDLEVYANVNLSEDAEVYSYDFLTSLPDMQVVMLPELGFLRTNDRVDTAKVIALGMKNARSVGTERDGKVYVDNRYTGRSLRIDVSSIRHGLNGNINRILTNARIGAVIGDVVQNAVPINALQNTASGVIGTYAMAQYAVDSNGREFVAIVTVEQRNSNVTEIQVYDVAHAISGRQKNSSQANTKFQGVYPSMAAKISIADFLNVVKATHQSVLSDSVLDQLGETRNPNGYYTGKAKFSIDLDYMDAVNRGDTEAAQKLVDEAAKQAGYTIHAYHGTSRGDRVGNVFLPERATSGPMAFFTSDRNIAEHYAHDKADTSLAYDEEYTDYYTQFRVNQNGKSIKVQDLWRSLPYSERARLKEAGKHITWDEDMKNPVWNDSATNGLGNWDAYTLNLHRGNAIEALIDCWLESGELYGNEGDFIKVLELAGIKGVEYRDPDVKHEKVYDVYLKIQNPFDTSTVNDEFADGFEQWYSQQPAGKYDRDTSAADMWDKNSHSAEWFLDKLRDDIANGTAYAWTSIPDSMTDYLKSLGYDGIQDKGGKFSGESHTVYIPFTSEQVKESAAVTYDDNGNVIPLSERFNSENRDIRYSLEGTENIIDEVRAARQVENAAKAQLAYLRKQVAVTKDATADPKSVERIARKLIASYGVEMDADALAQQLQLLYDSVLRKQDTDMWQQATDIARSIAEAITEVDGDIYTEYAELRKILKVRTIFVPEGVRSDIADYFDTVRPYRNRLKLTTKAESMTANNSLDIVFNDLAAEYPFPFDADTNAGSDQLRQIIYWMMIVVFIQYLQHLRI